MARSRGHAPAASLTLGWTSGPGRPGRVLISAFLSLALGTPAWAQSEQERAGLWARLQTGYGSLVTSSDQEARRRRGAFALGLSAGATPDPHVRVGAQVNGWLTQPLNLGDPERGESVSQVLAVVLVYPWRARGLFLKAGGGWASYSVNDPGGFGSGGWGLTVGVGHEWSLGDELTLSPVIEYACGSLGDVDSELVTLRNRHYGAFEIGLALTLR